MTRDRYSNLEHGEKCHNVAFQSNQINSIFWRITLSSATGPRSAGGGRSVWILKRFIFLLWLYFPVLPCFADAYNSVSLYSYSGYISTPSAYITDGRMGIHYTYLPQHVAPFHKGQSDNQVFSGTIGFLPFVEGYISVFSAPKIDISKRIANYGADKTRSLGIKVRILDERKWMPAVAFGIFDPSLKEVDVNLSANSISSFFWVTSKKYDFGTVSLGYGYKNLSGRYYRLKGLFGGVNVNLVDNVKLLSDYDGEFWSTGLNIRWKGMDILVASVQDHGPAYRFGYNWYLLN